MRQLVVNGAHFGIFKADKPVLNFKRLHDTTRLRPDISSLTRKQHIYIKDLSESESVAAALQRQRCRDLQLCGTEGLRMVLQVLTISGAPVAELGEEEWHDSSVAWTYNC